MDHRQKDQHWDPKKPSDFQCKSKSSSSECALRQPQLRPVPQEDQNVGYGVAYDLHRSAWWSNQSSWSSYSSKDNKWEKMVGKRHNEQRQKTKNAALFSLRVAHKEEFSLYSWMIE